MTEKPASRIGLRRFAKTRCGVPTRVAACFFAAMTLFVFPEMSAGYSVQTHEQLIDLTWKSSIQPFLLKRYSTMTDGQLREAHAYAYGGSAIQDLGYYPFGNAFFSDLTHYVRSGDFVRALLNDAKTPDELAFAVGALSHYVGDTAGHSEAVNPSVAIEFPKLGKEYGPSVTYAEGKHQHVRTEFAFDVNELSKHRFAPAAYLKSVGLSISVRLMAQAFEETYGLKLHEVLGKRGSAVERGYRFSVRRFLPKIAYAETVLHRNDFPADAPSADLARLEAELKQADFDNGWEKFRKKAGVGTYLLAGAIVVLPKVGVLSDLSLKGPTDDTEERYVASVLRSTDALRKDLQNDAMTAEMLPNRDLDTGAKVKPGGYSLTDVTYAQLLAQVTRLRAVPVGLKDDILEYYADPSAPIVTKKDPAKWARVQADLERLRTMPVGVLSASD